MEVCVEFESEPWRGFSTVEYNRKQPETRKENKTKNPEMRTRLLSNGLGHYCPVPKGVAGD